jgi:hypothetical protein
MPRLKRSQKERAVRPTPRPAAVKAAVGKLVVRATCPLCGHSVPEKRAIKAGYTTVDWIGYFDSIDWDPNKPFGTAFYATGGHPGPTANWFPIQPEDAPELFEAVKGRFLQALREWLDKGWIKREELPE